MGVNTKKPCSNRPKFRKRDQSKCIYTSILPIMEDDLNAKRN